MQDFPLSIAICRHALALNAKPFVLADNCGHAQSRKAAAKTMSKITKKALIVRRGRVTYHFELSHVDRWIIIERHVVLWPPPYRTGRTAAKFLVMRSKFSMVQARRRWYRGRVARPNPSPAA
jgi:hypothetical protein